MISKIKSLVQIREIPRKERAKVKKIEVEITLFHDRDQSPYLLSKGLKNGPPYHETANLNTLDIGGT